MKIFETAFLVGALVTSIGLYAYDQESPISLKASELFKLSDDQIQGIYGRIIAASGQTQDALPLVIDNSSEMNAHNDGTKIVIYRGLIDIASNTDEIALVLAHEAAHGMLGHLGALNTNVPSEIAVLEANADKYGAFLMMRAGFDICKGRELFKYWSDTYGNALNQDHPPFSYRHQELDVHCTW
jgi:hypothetical protein